MSTCPHDTMQPLQPQCGAWLRCCRRWWPHPALVIPEDAPSPQHHAECNDGGFGLCVLPANHTNHANHITSIRQVPSLAVHACPLSHGPLRDLMNRTVIGFRSMPMPRHDGQRYLFLGPPRAPSVSPPGRGGVLGALCCLPDRQRPCAWASAAARRPFSAATPRLPLLPLSAAAGPSVPLTACASWP